MSTWINSLGKAMYQPLFVVVSVFSIVAPLAFSADKDVAWLSEVNVCPDISSVGDFCGHVEPLGATNLAAWKNRRAELHQAWMKLLGPMPKFDDARYKILRTENLTDCIRQRIRYECEKGLFVEAYVLMPRGKHAANSLPGLVALHQTTRDTIEEIAGVKGPQMQHLGLKLARRGFVVICPRNFLWEQTTDYRKAVEDFRSRHPMALGMRKMLYDAVRATDILAGMDIVDPLRIGAVGHSLGAKETLYLAAFDDRIQAAVASEGGTAFKSTNWNAPWYLGKTIDERGFERNHHELLALIAPRPFLILAGEQGRGSADGLRSWPLVKPAQSIYKLSDESIRLGILNHGQGHSIPPKVFDQMAVWLGTYLAND